MIYGVPERSATASRAGDPRGAAPLGSPAPGVAYERRAADLTGPWRAIGADPSRPGLAHQLVLVQKGRLIEGYDTASRGEYRGIVSTQKGGGRLVRGSFSREDGTCGGFAVVVDRSGSRFSGTLTIAGKVLRYQGVKQGDGVGPGLGAFLARRRRGSGFG